MTSTLVQLSNLMNSTCCWFVDNDNPYHYEDSDSYHSNSALIFQKRTMNPVSSDSDSQTPLQRECVNLFKARQYKSCEIAARMELSKAVQEGRDPQMALALLGDCAQCTQQYRRAVSFYRRMKPYKYRWKEAQCLQALGNVVEASSVLEAVPGKARTLEMNMTLGNLYVASGRRNSAISAFMESLMQNPYALEAVEWLATLNADKAHVLEAIRRGFSARGVADDEALVPVGDLVSAQFAKHRHQTGPALQQFMALERKYINNPYLMVKIAELQVSVQNCRAQQA